MQVTCSNCGRAFELDEDRSRRHKIARCLCGADIDLRSSALGQRLGKYLLQERIAVGGMGEIFRAKMAGIEGFEREVAIKKMLPHLSADRDFVNMLVKEAKLTVLLHHPNIVQVYDLAREGDEYYIAMEYVPSVNLSALLEYCAARGMFAPVPLAISATLQILEGLSYAHNLKGADGQPMNILHRDITPQNILVTREGWVKITDFGIAKAKNEISTTRPGTIRGKLGYIAPEQLKSKEADQRVDIFCAGVVLWESLATRRLFKGNDEIDTLRLIVEARVPSLAEVRSGVPDALEAAVRRALARDPNDRFSTAAAFHDALLASIQPESADDHLKAAKKFLSENAQLFERASRSEPDSADNPTVALDEVPKKDDQPTITITELTIRPHGARRALVLSMSGLVLLALGAGGFGLWRRSLPPARSEGVPLPAPVVATPPPREPVAERPSKPQVAEESPRPTRPLTGEEIKRTVASYVGPIGRCLGQLDAATAPETVNAHLTIQPSGRVGNVQLEPSLTAAAATRCLMATLRGMRFRASPKAVEIIVPLHLQRYTSGH